MLRAENAEVVIHPDDRRYGALLVGGQGTGKTSALLGFYSNDVEDETAAPIVMDPKTELCPICLRATPPDCGKRVWFLDLGRPAFGMNPLLRPGERSLALEAAEIAENVVAALLDVYEDQIFASSRRYLYHAVIGALALAESEQRRPTFEDMRRLLEPASYELRGRAAQACADIPDLDFSAHFLGVELHDELRLAASQTAVRMDAPRNKISTLLQVAPIRWFFHHPTNITLREIIEARDILIVDCAQGRVGDDNVKPMLMFMLRMLHRQMQRQVLLPESERPRVPVLIDEAHYVSGVENVVDQIATHRRAGLEPAFGLQYFAQLGSGSRHEEKIRKGVLNLLQSRFLFRMGDAQDAEEATRIAMAAYATMIRDDPDSGPAAGHARAGAQLPQPLLPRLVDLERVANRKLHGRDVPAAGRRGGMGRTPPRQPGRARRPVSRNPRRRVQRHRRSIAASERPRARTGHGDDVGRVGARVPQRALRGEGRGQTARGAMGRQRPALAHSRRP